MLLHPHYPVSNISFLGVVLGILLAGTIASLLQKQLEQIPGLVTVLKEVETLADISYRALRRVMVLVLGTSVLLVGLAMVVLPGPAVVVIPIGLGILASEFAWARRLLKKARKKLEWVSQKNSRN